MAARKIEPQSIEAPAAATPRAGLSSWRLADIILRKVAKGSPTESEFIRAYLSLFVVPANDDGAKMVSLARFGGFDVRLVEFCGGLDVEVPLLWLELYAHDVGSLDSVRCDEFSQAVAAAREFILRAHRLDLECETCGGPV
jgi:hypothetical protein